MRDTWTTLIHGEEKAGKSWFADTAPGPKLVLDAEGRAKHTPSGPKVYWDPRKGGPPRHDGTWNTCIVMVPDYETVSLVYQWLRSCEHDFVTVIIDSLMELQKRCIDMIEPNARQLEQQGWGELLRRVERQVREFRDLTLVERNTVSVVVFITGSSHDDHRGWHPLLTGQLGKQIGYYLDTIGYLFKQVEPDGKLVRSLLIDKQPGFVAGDGTGKLVTHYGAVVPLPDGEQHIVNFMQVISGGKAA